MDTCVVLTVAALALSDPLPFGFLAATFGAIFVAPATGERGVTSLVLPLPPGSLGVTLGAPWCTLDPAQGVVSAADLPRALP